MAFTVGPTGAGEDEAVTLKGIFAIGRTGTQPSPWALVDDPVTGAPEAAVSEMNQVLKPYFLLACIAFFVGFASYLAMGSFMSTPGQVSDDWQASISVPTAPAADAAFVPGKRI